MLMCTTIAQFTDQYLVTYSSLTVGNFFQEAFVNPITNARILLYFKMKINPVRTTLSKWELQIPLDYLSAKRRVNN